MSSKYELAFDQFLDEHPNIFNSTTIVGQIADALGVSKSTINSKLKTYLSERPSLWGRIAGCYPSANAIIQEVERDFQCPILGHNLLESNEKSSAIVGNVMNATHANFLKELLAPFMQQNGFVNVPFTEIENLLRTDYSEFLTRVRNGLVSIAGTLNQKLLCKALQNVGLSDSGAQKGFIETGKKSMGDIQVYHYGASGNKTLTIEAKSYAARERLLRGLQDINQQPKVGVGFFNDHTEFNEERTRLFIESTGADAIYMPQVTYDQLATAARDMRRASNRLYRPLENFPEDMLHFNKQGALPTY